MKRIAALITLANVLGYLALMQVDPRYGLLQPRGGLLTLGISFSIAWVGLLAASREDLPLDRRFHHAAAAWIWLLVQSFGLGYIYWNAVAS
ncbi:hypothetical protein [Luteimonas sp. MHLX1A]|uniref:hypothetical protein n=1 Tax=Alterluteimonas muca TaxID=2878684 RepID=UPI001E3AAC1B|nr:hypothetical protein [Luteimonas sp. MHLX1A]MCD9047469.1 hypothetical protein [Luteimonas sp. MHLX1A]